MLGNRDWTTTHFQKEREDIAFYSSGIDECAKGSSYGPRTKRHHLIHIILDGRGILKIDNQAIPLSAPQAFLIPAGVSASYQADILHPWKYCWVGYQGNQADLYNTLLFGKDFSVTLNHVQDYEKRVMELIGITDLRVRGSLHYSEERFPEILFSGAQTAAQHLLVKSKLLEILSSMLNACGSTATSFDDANYAVKAKRQIDYLYDRPLAITELAKSMSIHPNYLSYLFKKEFEITPKEYLNRYRVEKAAALLQDTEFPVKKIASMVGISDPAVFSHLFKKVKSISPVEYRRTHPGDNPKPRDYLNTL